MEQHAWPFTLCLSGVAEEKASGTEFTGTAGIVITPFYRELVKEGGQGSRSPEIPSSGNPQNGWVSSPYSLCSSLFPNFSLVGFFPERLVRKRHWLLFLCIFKTANRPSPARPDLPREEARWEQPRLCLVSLIV